MNYLEYNKDQIVFSNGDGYDETVIHRNSLLAVIECAQNKKGIRCIEMYRIEYTRYADLMSRDHKVAYSMREALDKTAEAYQEIFEDRRTPVEVYEDENIFSNAHHHRLYSDADILAMLHAGATVINKANSEPITEAYIRQLQASGGQ